jgi:GNAT superfamily N-acetyltransferase
MKAESGQAGSFEIVFEPALARRVSRYVARSFFGPRELPQALARMVLTREFLLFNGVPLALLILARLMPDRVFGWDGVLIAEVLLGVAVAWLIVSMIIIARYGPSSGVGCFAKLPDGARGALVGGLRMRLQRGSRRLLIAGLLVEPEARGAGIGTALVLAAFRLALREAGEGPVTVTVFAPSHPASKAIVARQLGGEQAVLVEEPPSEQARAVIERLESALQDAPLSWSLGEGRLFGA